MRHGCPFLFPPFFPQFFLRGLMGDTRECSSAAFFFPSFFLPPFFSVLPPGRPLQFGDRTLEAKRPLSSFFPFFFSILFFLHVFGEKKFDPGVPKAMPPSPLPNSSPLWGCSSFDKTKTGPVFPPPSPSFFSFFSPSDGRTPQVEGTSLSLFTFFPLPCLSLFPSQRSQLLDLQNQGGWGLDLQPPPFPFPYPPPPLRGLGGRRRELGKGGGRVFSSLPPPFLDPLTSFPSWPPRREGDFRSLFLLIVFSVGDTHEAKGFFFFLSNLPPLGKCRGEG